MHRARCGGDPARSPVRGMSTLLPLPVTVALLLAALTLVGRAAVPCAERVRLRCWRPRDVLASTAIGGRQVVNALEYAHRRTSGLRP